MSDNSTVLNPAAKRRPPAAGMGRRKGVANKVTSDVRNMILGALNEAGGQKYLAARAIDTPGPFLALVGKCLPKEIRAEVAATHVIASLTPEQQRGIAEAILGIDGQ
jgi:hypothetical protein